MSANAIKIDEFDVIMNALIARSQQDVAANQPSWQAAMPAGQVAGLLGGWLAGWLIDWLVCFLVGSLGQY